MQIEHIRDFVVFVDYMNISKAARALHMSQPNLSKRIHSIEREVGFPLLEYNGNHISLTLAGESFYYDMNKLLSEYDKSLENAVSLSKKSREPILARYPTFPDLAQTQILSLIGDFQAKTKIPVRFTNTVFVSGFDQVSQGICDLHELYSFGDTDEIIEMHTKPPVYLEYLTEEPLGIRCSQSNPLASCDVVTVEDLQHVLILRANHVARKLDETIDKLCESRGFDPVYRNYHADTLVEYCTPPVSDETVQILPLSMTRSPLCSINPEVISIPMEKDAVVKSFLLINTTKLSAQSFRKMMFQ